MQPGALNQPIWTFSPNMHIACMFPITFENSGTHERHSICLAVLIPFNNAHFYLWHQPSSQRHVATIMSPKLKTCVKLHYALVYEKLTYTDSFIPSFENNILP